MDERLFLELLKKGEGPTLDYKSEQYRWDEHGKASLIKDVMAMANTPRDGSSYILIGAKKVNDQTYEPIDVPDHPDGAQFQDVVKSWVHPVPRFQYQTFTVQGKRCGTITIDPVRQGPSLAREDLANGYVRRRVVYWRRGDQNDEARQEELVEITAWCNPRRLPGPVHVQPGTSDLWEQFASAVDWFDVGRTYVLITGPGAGLSQEEMGSLGLIDWDFVLDFDCDTEINGVAKAANPILIERRLRHLLRFGDRPSLNIGRATYWFAARGLSDMSSTLCDPVWLKWNSKYYSELQTQLSRLAAASPKPCTAVVLWDDPEYVRSACTALNAAFGDRVSYVFVNPSEVPMEELSDQFGGRTIATDAHRLCGELSEHMGKQPESQEGTPACEFPTLAGGTVVVASHESAWLSEELEPVYLSAGSSPPESRNVGTDYLRGHEITWYELGLRYDIDRDITERIVRQVRRDLTDRVSTRINLFHFPGAGGTTVAKRILWDIHREFPCVVIRRCRPAETLGRLRYVFSKSNQAVLALVEGAQIKENDSEDLFNACRAQQIPVVFLNVLRRFAQTEERDRTFYQRGTLTDAEADRFSHVYGREVPHRSAALARVARSADQRLRTPFYFGLEAFEHNFAGLSAYVEARIGDTTLEQKEMMCFLALAHHYAQKPLNAQLFAGILHIPKDRRVRMESVLPDQLLELLINDSDGDWRPSHDLVAEEIMHQILCPDLADRRTWREGLSTWGCRFAEFCRGDDPVPSDDVMETISRCFVLRDNRDLLGTESAVTQTFSQWVEDTPRQGRLPLLHRLTELFPDEPHFWAHLGRFYSIEMSDPDKAMDAADHALALSPDDPVLHHMRGMILRKTAYDKMSGQQDDALQVLQDVVGTAKESAAEFAASRELAPDGEHGYISHIQLITRVLDFAFRTSGSEDRATFLTAPGTNAWIRESLDEAEDLLDQVRRLREGQQASEFEQRCRNDVQALYGRYDLALQGWDNLLARPGVYKPPIRRQLVRTYLARRDRAWEHLDERELRRVIGLLEDNILEEPNEDRNLRLWIQAIRCLPQLASLDTVIERVSYWKARSDTLDAAFYLYVLHGLNALEGSPLAVGHAAEVLEDCKKKAKERKNRTVSLEWIGNGRGLGRLVHHSRLGEWDKTTDFWENPELLGRVAGRIASMAGPEAGQVELACGLKAFFVPAKSGDTVDGKRSGLVVGRDENKAVTALLGFSYDGLRAWDVRLSE